MTFEDVKEKSWQLSQETLMEWKNRIEVRLREKSPAINQHLADLAVLHGEPVPENVVVSLQYYPREGIQKGEPIDNFAQSGRLEEGFADVLYWVSNPSIVPGDSEDDIERLYMETSDRIIIQTLHEVQHRNFQKESYAQLIKEAEQHTFVKTVLDKLRGSSGDYIEVTNELITTYLESFGLKILQEREQSSDGEENTPLNIEVDKEKHGRVLEAVIRQDVESDKKKGPYTDLRQCWEKALDDGLPEGYKTVDVDLDLSDEASDRSFMGTNIYEIARELDTSLVERYVKEGRQIDVDFVVGLYKLVNERLSAVEIED